jgi:hypothetical protein
VSDCSTRTATRKCPQCRVDRTGVLTRLTATNGVAMVGWRSTECDHWLRDAKGRAWIPHADLAAAGVDMATIPELVDYSTWAICEHCSARGVDFHHTAPSAMFADAHLWPIVLLCPACHHEWHRVVTPQLCGRA